MGYTRNYAQVKISLSEPFYSQPIFTLFRGYRVTGITDFEGNSFDFLQEGDHVKIVSSEDWNATSFVFEYSGSGWGKYANRQGIFLPSNFPWYPWPGLQKFYWDDGRHSVGVALHIPRQGSVEEMSVKVQSSFDEIFTPHGVIISAPDEFYRIPAESLTLMAGDVHAIGEDSLLRFYGGRSCLEWYSLVDDEINIANISVRQRIVDEAYSLRGYMGLSELDMQSRTFILVPSIPAHSNLYFMPVNQEGYIMVSSTSAIDYAVALAFQDIPQEYDKRELYEVLYRFLSDPADHFFLNPGHGRLSLDGLRASKIGNLFTDVLEVSDDAYVVRRTVEYLMDTSEPAACAAFLYSLMNE